MDKNNINHTQWQYDPRDEQDMAEAMENDPDKLQMKDPNTVINTEEDFEGMDATYKWEYAREKTERVDKFVSQQYQNISRAQIQHFIRDGFVKVNDKQVKANHKLYTGDVVVLQIPQPQEVTIEPQPMDLHIVFEDEDVLVVNKPAGLVVHPAPGHLKGTLVNGLLAHCDNLSEINGQLRSGIVHRLDKDTSGLLMVAKNDPVHRSLVEQLQNHTVTRRYVAIVQGQVPHQQGTIEAPIGRHPKHRQQMAVVEGGKEATTHFEVLERFADHTYVQLQLETGRTHQIRVHMKYMGHPLAGDPKYTRTRSPYIARQALHAKEIGFTHPRTGASLMFDADLPEDMDQMLTRLRMREK